MVSIPRIVHTVFAILLMYRGRVLDSFFLLSFWNTYDYFFLALSILLLESTRPGTFK